MSNSGYKTPIPVSKYKRRVIQGEAFHARYNEWVTVAEGGTAYAYAGSEVHAEGGSCTYALAGSTVRVLEGKGAVWGRPTVVIDRGGRIIYEECEREKAAKRRQEERNIILKGWDLVCQKCIGRIRGFL